MVFVSNWIRWRLTEPVDNWYSQEASQAFKNIPMTGPPHNIHSKHNSQSRSNWIIIQFSSTYRPDYVGQLNGRMPCLPFGNCLYIRKAFQGFETVSLRNGQVVGQFSQDAYERFSFIVVSVTKLNDQFFMQHYELFVNDIGRALEGRMGDRHYTWRLNVLQKREMHLSWLVLLSDVAARRNKPQEIVFINFHSISGWFLIHSKWSSKQPKNQIFGIKQTMWAVDLEVFFAAWSWEKNNIIFAFIIRATGISARRFTAMALAQPNGGIGTGGFAAHWRINRFRKNFECKVTVAVDAQHRPGRASLNRKWQHFFVIIFIPLTPNHINCWIIFQIQKPSLRRTKWMPREFCLFCVV